MIFEQNDTITQSLDEKNIELQTEFCGSYHYIINYLNLNLIFFVLTFHEDLTQAALDPNQSQVFLIICSCRCISDGDELKVNHSTQILDAFQSFSLTKSLIVQLEYYFNVINPFIVSLFLYLLIVFGVFVSFFCLKSMVMFNKRYLAT